MKNKILITLFVIILFTFAFVSYNFIYNVRNFKEHREYFKKPVDEQKIADWMPLNYLERHYRIDLEKAFGKTIYFWEMSKTLKEYCNENKLNCDELILSLEKYKNGY